MTDELDRQIRDELIKQINKRVPSPIQPGVVSDNPDTYYRTAQVRIGTKVVTASYRGQTPVVGEEVYVGQVGPEWRLITNVPSAPSTSVGGGNVNLPPAPSQDTSFISELWLWGHSYLGSNLGNLGGYAFPDGEQTIDNRIFGALDISWPRGRNFGNFGACIVDDWDIVMKMAGYPYNPGVGPYLNPRGNHAFIYGANDVGFHGDPLIEGGRQLQSWQNCWRTAINWLRAGGVFQDDQILGEAPYGTTQLAGVTYQAARWTVGSSPNFFTEPFTGSGYHQTIISNSTFTVTVPADAPSPIVTLYFIGEIGAGVGAPSASVTTPTETIYFSTDNTKRYPTVGTADAITRNGTVPIRVFLPNKGVPQTLTVNSGPLSSGRMLRFDCWSIEALNPPMICIGNVPPVADWCGGGYNSKNVNPNGDPNGILWPGYPNSNGMQPPTGSPTNGPPINPSLRAAVQEGDKWVATYNTALIALAAEFAPLGTVIIADLATVFDGRIHSDLYKNAARSATTAPVGWDPIHPNNIGRQVIAEAIIGAMQLAPTPLVNLIAPYSANEPFFVSSMLGNIL